MRVLRVGNSLRIFSHFTNIINPNSLTQLTHPTHLSNPSAIRHSQLACFNHSNAADLRKEGSDTDLTGLTDSTDRTDLTDLTDSADLTEPAHFTKSPRSALRRKHPRLQQWEEKFIIVDKKVNEVEKQEEEEEAT
eukprot:GHVN01104827.1.p1 GENE.GHVN01104827.1~~GHVN01104827.1.p1  ORF type:complete len:135 (+),score=44.54 GHVN01104827.1:255-659(+)